MQKGYEDATCEKCDSTPRNENTAGQTKRIRRSTKYANFAAGQSVEDFWNDKDLEGTNGQPGWYNGEIQHFHEENGAIYTLYFKDRAVYSLHATGALVDGIIHSIRAVVRRQELKTFNSYSIRYLQLYYVC